MLQQLHEEGNFVGGPLPVLAGQAVERELLDAQPGAFLGHPADDVGPAAMPLDPRQASPPRPAAVAVHDDGDMPRHLRCGHGDCPDFRISENGTVPLTALLIVSGIVGITGKNRLLTVGPDGNHLHRPADQLAQPGKISSGVRRKVAH